MPNTPFHDWHAAHGGRMVDFAGWQMPMQYTTIVQEHQAVRARAGLFDIAHMGRLRFAGPDAGRFLDRLCTNSVAAMQPGQVRYSLVCREDGGILDDVLIYRFPEFHLLVVNASNREKILGWIEQQRGGFDVVVDDLTFEWAMLALQGPRALEILRPLTPLDLASMKYYSAAEANVCGSEGIVSRTGYTGEDGFEVMVPSRAAVELWESLLAAGKQAGLVPCGLGCRDTLRLEAGMPLYGHEMDETVDPFTAGLGFGVKLDAAEFIGSEALRRLKAQPTGLTRIGLVLAEKRPAREGARVLAGSGEIGHVTSGTFSPTLERPLAMARVAADGAQVGDRVEVDIRGQFAAAEVVRLPFYKRSS